LSGTADNLSEATTRFKKNTRIQDQGEKKKTSSGSDGQENQRRKAQRSEKQAKAKTEENKMISRTRKGLGLPQNPGWNK
jgi:hypothetical protein